MKINSKEENKQDKNDVVISSEQFSEQQLSEARENSRAILKVLTGKNNVLFTRRCNESIRLAMLLIASLGRSNVLYPEEGGWLTYKKFIEKAGLSPIILHTDDGLIYSKDLEHHEHDSALLVNSMAGYIVPQDMGEITNTCFTNDIILVNDVSGSIGSEEAKFGEIIVGSFGNSKPVNLGKGGFIAMDDDLYDLFNEQNDDFEEEELNYVFLEKKLLRLNDRIDFLKDLVSKVKDDLKSFRIVHPEGDGLNVVVRFSSDVEKKKITDYCEDNGLEFTVCPREIRILDDAISIEIKRRIL